MMDKLKSIKLDVTLAAVLSVVLGVLLVVWPGTVITVLARVIAIILMGSGIVALIPRLLDEIKSVTSIIVSLLITLIGLWMFLSPQAVASIIPIAIGVLLVVHGVQDLALAFEGRRTKAHNWWSIPLMAILNIVLGILCICNAFGLVKLGMILIGIMLIYDGISDMFIVHKVNKASKEFVDSTILHEENIDDYV